MFIYLNIVLGRFYNKILLFFLVDELETNEKNQLYKDYFKDIFNIYVMIKPRICVALLILSILVYAFGFISKMVITWNNDAI